VNRVEPKAGEGTLRATLDTNTEEAVAIAREVVELWRAVHTASLRRRPLWPPAHHLAGSDRRCPVAVSMAIGDAVKSDQCEPGAGLDFDVNHG
jgi:hypothetical protein